MAVVTDTAMPCEAKCIAVVYVSGTIIKAAALKETQGNKDRLNAAAGLSEWWKGLGF